MQTKSIKSVLKTLWCKHLCALAAYSFAFIFLTWPLVQSIGTHILGFYRSDAPIFLWNAWEWQNKFSAGDLSYYAKDIFYPNSVSIIFHTHTFVQSAIIAVFNVVVRNVILSFNFVYWLSAVAGAFFTYLFFLKKTKHYFASLLAGQFFGFQHLWAVYSLFGTQNIISFWYIPAGLCAYAYFQEKYHKRYIFLAGAILGLAFLNDFNMFAFAGGALGVYVIATHIVEKHGLKQIVQQWAILLVSFVLVAGWNIGYIVRHKQEIAHSAVPSVSDVDYYHADPINLVRPSRLHMLWPKLNSMFTTASQSQGNAFLGFTTFFILLSVFLVWKRTKQAPDQKPFIVYGALFLVVLSLSFGPYAHIAGVLTPLPMPYFFIGKIVTQFNNLRVPLRWLFPSMFFFAGIVAFSLQYVFQKISTKAVLILSILLFNGFLLDSWLGPKQLLVVDSYPTVSDEIRSNPGVVMELPLAISSGFYAAAEGARINQLHQVSHGQPIIGGTLSRAPKNFIESYEKEPVIKFLLLYKNAQPDAQDVDEKNIQIFFSKYNVRYILFDKQLGESEDVAGKSLFSFINKKLRFSKFYEDDKVVAFKLK